MPEMTWHLRCKATSSAALNVLCLLAILGKNRVCVVMSCELSLTALCQIQCTVTYVPPVPRVQSLDVRSRSHIEFTPLCLQVGTESIWESVQHDNVQDVLSVCITLQLLWLISKATAFLTCQSISFPIKTSTWIKNPVYIHLPVPRTRCTFYSKQQLR